MHIVLCFAFVAGMVLIKHSVLATAEQRLHLVKAFFAPPGGGQEAGRVHSQHIWQPLTKGHISYILMILCSAKKAERNEEKVGLLVAT